MLAGKIFVKYVSLRHTMLLYRFLIRFVNNYEDVKHIMHTVKTVGAKNFKFTRFFNAIKINHSFIFNNDD